jgi:dimethylamine monooxygenase subunit C
MLRPGMKSRPVYPGLVADGYARHNLISAEGEGAQAVFELVGTAPAGFLDKTTLLYCPAGSAGKGYEDRLKRLGAQTIWVLPTAPTAMFRLRGTLATATMGLRLYATGTEPFIGSVIQVAIEHGIDHKSVICEHRGSARRRVQCVHCKGNTEDVTTNPAICSHCGLNLLVRDHYSRRLGAFMGVCIDAEVPGELPPTQELFP